MFHHTPHFGHQAYGYGHAIGHGYGIGGMIMHAIINGLIYSFIFRLMRSMTLTEAAVLVVVVIGGIWLMSKSPRRRY